MKIWFIFFLVWIAACLGTYAWLNPLSPIAPEAVVVEPLPELDTSAPVTPSNLSVPEDVGEQIQDIEIEAEKSHHETEEIEDLE